MRIATAVRMGVTVVALLGGADAAPLETSASAPAHECDALAADGFDAQRVRRGVPPDELDGERAIAACSAAVERFPAVARFRAQLGRAFLKQEDFPAALEQLELAAEMGSALARHLVAEMYIWGNGVGADRVRGFDLMLQAAEEGYVPAQVKLGWMVEDRFVSSGEDKAVAAEWAERAARARTGFTAEAQRVLCWMHQTGEGLAANARAAFDWCKAAAEGGEIGAQNDLAWMYRRGLGVPQNIAEAVRWYGRTAAEGDEWGLNQLKAFSGRELAFGIQTLLWEEGYDVGPIDGIVRPHTLDAIAAFSKKNGLPAPAEIGPDLVIRLVRDSR